MSIDEYFEVQQAAWDALFSGPEMAQPRTYIGIDLSRIPPKPWPWPRSMTDAEIAEYQAMLGDEYRITRGFVTWRGDQVYGEPV